MNNLKLLDINRSKLLFCDDGTCVKDYYFYILEIVIEILQNNDFNCVILFSPYNMNTSGITLDLDIPLIRLNMNIEHTLVKPGGRDTYEAPMGNIPIPKQNENYLVRFEKLGMLQNSTIVIDYSMPNIINARESVVFQDIFEKMVYISPILYNFYGEKENRNIELLTTFQHTEPRRKTFLDNASAQNINIYNVEDCFDKSKLEELLHSTKIMINVHQTDHHDTIEEFRILPALSCGIIVISEEGALIPEIPYHKYIIWTSYENLIPCILNVQQNYDKYVEKIFGNNDIESLLDSLHNANVENMESKIKKSIQNGN